MEKTWELIGLNDGWKSEKVKVWSKTFKNDFKKQLYACILKNMPHSMTNSTIFFRMEL